MSFINLTFQANFLTWIVKQRVSKNSKQTVIFKTPLFMHKQERLAVTDVSISNIKVSDCHISICNNDHNNINNIYSIYNNYSNENNYNDRNHKLNNNNNSNYFCTVIVELKMIRKNDKYFYKSSLHVS